MYRNNLKYIFGSPLLYLVALPLMGESSGCFGPRTSKPKGSTKSLATENKPTLSPTQEEEEEEADKDLAQGAAANAADNNQGEAANKPADSTAPQEQGKKEKNKMVWVATEEEDTSWLKNYPEEKKAAIGYIGKALKWIEDEYEEEQASSFKNRLNEAFEYCKDIKELIQSTDFGSDLKGVHIDDLNCLIHRIDQLSGCIKPFKEEGIKIEIAKDNVLTKLTKFLDGELDRVLGYRTGLKNTPGVSRQKHEVIAKLDNVAITKNILLNDYKTLLDNLPKVTSLLKLSLKLANCSNCYINNVLRLRIDLDGSSTDERAIIGQDYINFTEAYILELARLINVFNIDIMCDGGKEFNWNDNIVERVKEEAQIAVCIDSIHEHWKTIRGNLQEVHCILNQDV